MTKCKALTGSAVKELILWNQRCSLKDNNPRIATRRRLQSQAFSRPVRNEAPIHLTIARWTSWSLRVVRVTSSPSSSSKSICFFLCLSLFTQQSNRYKSVQTEYKSGQDRKAARAAVITALICSSYKWHHARLFVAFPLVNICHTSVLSSRL